MADGESNFGWVAAAVAGLLGVAGAVVAYNCGHSNGYEDGLGEQNEDFKRKCAELREIIAKEKDRADKAIKKLQRIKTNYLELVKWAYDNGGMTKEEFDYFKNTVESELDLEGQERIAGIRNQISESIDGLRGISAATMSSSSNLGLSTPMPVAPMRQDAIVPGRPIKVEPDGWWDRWDGHESSDVSAIDVFMRGIMSMGSKRI